MAGQLANTHRTSLNGSDLANGEPHGGRQAAEAAIGDFLRLSQRTLDQIDRHVLGDIIDCLMDVWRGRSTVYVMGNGGSASTATHFAADLAKYTISDGKPRFKVL